MDRTGFFCLSQVKSIVVHLDKYVVFLSVVFVSTGNNSQTNVAVDVKD